jgi:hypothetical protein
MGIKKRIAQSAWGIALNHQVEAEVKVKGRVRVRYHESDLCDPGRDIR